MLITKSMETIHFHKNFRDEDQFIDNFFFSLHVRIWIWRYSLQCSPRQWWQRPRRSYLGRQLRGIFCTAFTIQFDSHILSYCWSANLLVIRITITWPISPIFVTKKETSESVVYQEEPKLCHEKMVGCKAAWA